MSIGAYGTGRVGSSGYNDRPDPVYPTVDPGEPRINVPRINDLRQRYIVEYKTAHETHHQLKNPELTALKATGVAWSFILVGNLALAGMPLLVAGILAAPASLLVGGGVYALEKTVGEPVMDDKLFGWHAAEYLDKHPQAPDDEVYHTAKDITEKRIRLYYDQVRANSYDPD